ncbi:MAG: putative molybdenum carrier protein, partial [Gammaproteobacteria bacterium]
LDFAIRHGFDHGGWCPKGRLAEDGPIPSRYHLEETASPDSRERTERNVLDSDATLIIVRDEPLVGGTALTHELAARHRRPVVVLRESDGAAGGARAAAEFLRRNAVMTLNVAGPRDSEAPGLGEYVKQVLESAILMLKA